LFIVFLIFFQIENILTYTAEIGAEVAEIGKLGLVWKKEIKSATNYQ
jgi:hypothetical protein